MPLGAIFVLLAFLSVFEYLRDFLRQFILYYKLFLFLYYIHKRSLLATFTHLRHSNIHKQNCFYDVNCGINVRIPNCFVLILYLKINSFLFFFFYYANLEDSKQIHYFKINRYVHIVSKIIHNLQVKEN